MDNLIITDIYKLIYKYSTHNKIKIDIYYKYDDEILYNLIKNFKKYQELGINIVNKIPDNSDILIIYGDILLDIYNILYSYGYTTLSLFNIPLNIYDTFPLIFTKYNNTNIYVLPVQCSYCSSIFSNIYNIIKCEYCDISYHKKCYSNSICSSCKYISTNILDTYFISDIIDIVYSYI